MQKFTISASWTQIRKSQTLQMITVSLANGRNYEGLLLGDYAEGFER